MGQFATLRQFNKYHTISLRRHLSHVQRVKNTAKNTIIKYIFVTE